jgi:hypothetical protein
MGTIWHEKTEEPQNGKSIVFVTVDKQVVDMVMPYHSSSVVPWKTYVEATGLSHWVYRKDLFQSIKAK